MTVNTESLKLALQMLKPLFTGKTTIEATQYVLIKDGYVHGTDLTSSIKAKFESEGDESIVVRYDELVSLVEACKRGDIDLSLIPTGDALMCHFRSGRKRGKFPAMDLSEMISMDFSKPERLVELKSIDVYQYAKFASEFTSKDDLIRPCFEQVNFLTGDGEVRIVATDGNCLFHCKPYIENKVDFEEKIGISRKLIPILKEMVGMVKIGCNETHSYFESENATLLSRKAEGSFPTISQIESIFNYPKEYSNEINLKDFLDDVKGAAAFSKKDSWLLIFDGDNIKAENIDYNKEMNVKTSLDMPRCGFSARNLLKIPEIDITATVSVSGEKPLSVVFDNMEVYISPIILGD